MRGVPGGSTGLMRRRKVAFSQRHGRLPIYAWSPMEYGCGVSVTECTLEPLTPLMSTV
jgi:hypothetical protein